VTPDPEITADQGKATSPHGSNGQSLDQCEAVIRRSLTDAAEALRRIRDDRLYKQAGFTSFDAYTRERLGMGRERADQIINAGAIVAELPTKVGSSLTERQARALAPLRADPD